MTINHNGKTRSQIKEDETVSSNKDTNFRVDTIYSTGCEMASICDPNIQIEFYERLAKKDENDSKMRGAMFKLLKPNEGEIDWLNNLVIARVFLQTLEMYP